MKVLCTSLNAEVGPHFEILRNAGYQVEVVDRSLDLWQPENMIRSLQGCVASIAGSEPYPRQVIEALPELRVIARTGVGFDAIDLAACDEQGVVVATTPGVNHHAVAEHTIALLMGVARGFPDAHDQVREHRWKRVAYPRVMGRTLGVVGLGRIGQAVVSRALGLGLKVLVHDPYPNNDFVKQWSIPLVSLPELFSQSDFISLHCPATRESYHLINEQTISTMKKGAVILNTARGTLIDEKALAAALKSGQLGGAGLDVFEVEPLPKGSPLFECPNVLFSGHIAGLDQESHEDTFAMSAQTIIALQKGEWPTMCIQNLKGQTGWCWLNRGK